MSFRIEQHLDALRDPACFGERGPVEVLQTHISVICLVGERAFKFKKAVALPFVDFTTFEARERSCHDELRLNRRLAPDIYLAVEHVWRGVEGGLRVGEGGAGQRVDTCVVMRRMPQERMLDRLLEQDAVREADVRRLARIVAEFHARAAREADDEVRRLGAADRLTEQIRANFADTESGPVDCFDDELHDAVRLRVEVGLPELERRLTARDDRIVEGHGDLHSRNICLIEPPAVYDCVEFRRDFRTADVATDIAFLVMDLRHRGHRELADAFVDEYVAASGDHDVPVLLPELVRYRAMVRAKVDAIAQAESGRSTDDRRRDASAARRRLRLCAWTLCEERGRFAVVGCGLPASGKSTLLDALSRETGWPRIATDAVRKELAGAAPEQRLDAGFYETGFSDRTYAEVLRRAGATLRPVILDGNFPTAARREEARAAAGRVIVVEVRVDEATARERLARRSASGTGVSDADVGVWEQAREKFEPPADATVIDGGAPLDEALDRLALALLERVAPT